MGKSGIRNDELDNIMLKYVVKNETVSVCDKMEILSYYTQMNKKFPQEKYQNLIKLALK